MTKEEFEELFKKGFNKQKITYEDAQNGESEIECFKCGYQTGIKEDKIVCVNNHEDTFLNYTGQYIEMEHDFLNCKLNNNCQNAIQSDY